MTKGVRLDINSNEKCLPGSPLHAVSEVTVSEVKIVHPGLFGVYRDQYEEKNANDSVEALK